jgi:uncharacterized protein DUF1573
MKTSNWLMLVGGVFLAGLALSPIVLTLSRRLTRDPVEASTPTRTRQTVDGQLVTLGSATRPPQPTAAADSAPRLVTAGSSLSVVIRNADVDLGELYEGEQPSMPIVFENPSEKQVELVDVASSCTCILPPKPFRLTIQPHESRQVSIGLRTLGRHGRLAQDVTFVDSNGNRLRAGIRAHVVSAAPGFPPEIALGDQPVNSELARDFTFVLPGKSPTEVRVDTSSTDLYGQASLVENGFIYVLWSLRVPATPTPNASYQLTTTVHLASGEVHRFVSNLVLNIRPLVEAIPSTINCGGIASARTGKTCTIIVNDPSIQTLRVSTKDTWLTATISAEPKHQRDLTVRVDVAQLEEGPFRGLLKVCDGGGNRELVTVIVQGVKVKP